VAKKKEIKKLEFPEHYYVLGADLSLKRPGFCLLSVDKAQGSPIIKVKKLVSLDNKTDHKKSHGQLLEEIRHFFIKSFFPLPDAVYAVRETEIMKVKVPSERSLSKVVGLTDWMLWKISEKEWNSIYPTSVKKLITGSGKAEKEEVAKALDKYVGKQDYKCDDESDSVAVAIAWLIQQEEIKQIEEII